MYILKCRDCKKSFDSHKTGHMGWCDDCTKKLKYGKNTCPDCGGDLRKDMVCSVYHGVLRNINYSYDKLKCPKCGYVF